MPPFFANSNPIPSEHPMVTIGFSIVMFGRNFRIFQVSDFQKSKNFGEKIEKIKIGSNNFKICPWATQSPNMSFQLPLEPKIIAVEF